MTIDELIALAREVIAHNAEVRTVSNEVADYLDNDTADGRLARSVLALLAPDKPCGWDEGDVVRVEDVEIDGKQFSPAVHIHANGKGFV